MWAAAKEASELRQLVERVKASELEIAAAEAADAQSHWDQVVSAFLLPSLWFDSTSILDVLYSDSY